MMIARTLPAEAWPPPLGTQRVSPWQWQAPRSPHPRCSHCQSTGRDRPACPWLILLLILLYFIFTVIEHEVMFTGNKSNKPGQAEVGHQLGPVVVFYILLLVKEVLVDSATSKQPNITIISNCTLNISTSTSDIYH